MKSKAKPKFFYFYAVGTYQTPDKGWYPWVETIRLSKAGCLKAYSDNYGRFFSEANYGPDIKIKRIKIGT